MTIEGNTMTERHSDPDNMIPDTLIERVANGNNMVVVSSLIQSSQVLVKSVTTPYTYSIVGGLGVCQLAISPWLPVSQAGTRAWILVDCNHIMHVDDIVLLFRLQTITANNVKAVANYTKK